MHYQGTERMISIAELFHMQANGQTKAQTVPGMRQTNSGLDGQDKTLASRQMATHRLFRLHRLVDNGLVGPLN